MGAAAVPQGVPCLEARARVSPGVATRSVAGTRSRAPGRPAPPSAAPRGWAVGGGTWSLPPRLGRTGASRAPPAGEAGPAVPGLPNGGAGAAGPRSTGLSPQPAEGTRVRGGRGAAGAGEVCGGRSPSAPVPLRPVALR